LFLDTFAPSGLKQVIEAVKLTNMENYNPAGIFDVFDKDLNNPSIVITFFQLK
jgi:hypothetical protein